MKWFLLGLSLVFLGLRFFDLSTAPFINDEPQLQILSQKSASSPNIASLGLEGTRGVKYGPTAVWFYSALRRISPELNFQLTIFASTIVLAFLIWTYLVYRIFGEESSLYFLALVSTSPFLTFYSRQLWDNTLQIFLWSIALLMVFFIYHQRNKVICFPILSVVLGLLFDLHLMCVASIAFTAFWVGKRNLKWGLFLISSSFFIAVTFPYLIELFKMKHQASVGTSWPGQPIRVLISALNQFSIFYSSHGARFLFDGSKEAFHEFAGAGFHLLFQWDANYVFTLLALIASYRIYRSPERESFKGFLALLGPICILYYAFIGLSPLFPHYFGTLWFLTPFWLGYWLTQWKGKPLLALKAVLVFTSIVNATFLVTSYRFIKTHSGTRGDKYGTVHPEIKKASDQLCTYAKENGQTNVSLDLHLVPGVLLPSFQYFISNSRGCETLTVTRQDSGTANYILKYRSEPKDTAELIVIDPRHPG